MKKRRAKKPRPKKKKPQTTEARKVKAKKTRARKDVADTSNMGRPKLWQNPIRKLITLESHQWDKLERIADGKGLNVSRLIQYWVGRQKG